MLAGPPGQSLGLGAGPAAHHCSLILSSGRVEDRWPEGECSLALRFVGSPRPHRGAYSVELRKGRKGSRSGKRERGEGRARLGVALLSAGRVLSGTASGAGGVGSLCGTAVIPAHGRHG